MYTVARRLKTIYIALCSLVINNLSLHDYTHHGIISLTNGTPGF